MKNKYYAIYGSNGLGIYTDYDKVLMAKPYIGKGFKVKGYVSREEACAECIDGYNDLQSDIEGCYMLNSLEKNNFTIYRKQIRQLNVEGRVAV